MALHTRTLLNDNDMGLKNKIVFVLFLFCSFGGPPFFKNIFDNLVHYVLHHFKNICAF